MTKKGLFVTLMTVTFAFLRISSFALAPVIRDPGDVIIGDLEQQAGNNVFVFPDAIDLDSIVSDDNTANTAIKWSYSASIGNVTINGVPQIGAGDPNNPLGSSLRTNDNDTAVPNDAAAHTITFRNNFYSDITVGGGLGPYADPGTTAPAFLENEMITLFASDCTTYSSTSITVYTADNTSDSISGGSVLTLLTDQDYDNDPSLIAGWFGGVVAGTGTTGTATGLCMWVPAVNNSTAAQVGWISPPNFAVGGMPATPYSTTGSHGWITLKDKTVYRIRLTMWTDETAVGAIPFWTFGYNNLNASGVGVSGNTYGGDIWTLDVAGGADGINDPNVNGRTQGRVTFDYWFAPDAMLAAQWRGTLSGALAGDNANSPFDPAYALVKDMSFVARILDGQQNTGIRNEVDAGTICVKELRVDSANYDDLAGRVSSSYNHPITVTVGANHGLFAVNPDTFSGGGDGTGTIDNATNTATFIMGPNYTGAVGSNSYKGGRKSLIFYDDTQDTSVNFNTALFPVIWKNNQVVQLAVGIRSGFGGGAGTTEGTDPVDTIFINFDTPTNEVGGFNFTQIGAAGDMFRAASPRLKANTGGVSQVYTAFFAAQNVTVIDPIANPTFVNSNRIRGYPDFINNASLGGSGTNGKDPIILDSMVMSEIDTTGF